MYVNPLHGWGCICGGRTHGTAGGVPPSRSQAGPTLSLAATENSRCLLVERLFCP